MGRHSAPVDHKARRVGTVAALSGGAFLAPTAVGLLPEAHADVLDAIEKCESGGNATAHNPSSSASGLFQFLTSTWLANGGGEYAPTAAQATPAQQRLVAERLLAREGTTPWNASRSCWLGHEQDLVVSKVPAPRTIPSVVVHEDVTPMVDSEYTVVKGDCLSVIAERFGITTADLYNPNRDVIGGNEDLIYPGQVLKVTGTSTGQHADSGPQHAAPVEAPLAHYVLHPWSGEVNGAIDMSAPLGDPIYSATSGVVEFAGPAHGFGDWIVITSVVDGMKVDFVYGHEYPRGILVQPGEKVSVGEHIGNVGANGNATGPHVHFEVWVGGRVGGHSVDAVGWMRAHGVNL